MKKLLSILILPLILFGYKIEITEWGKGNTFFGFLKKYHIPYSLYYNLDKKTQKKISYISSKATIYILEDGNNLKQALIPLDENSQLQIVKKGKKYKTAILPINYVEEEHFASVNIKNFLSYDIYQTTQNPYLSSKLANIFNDRINFKFLPKNTKIDIYYKTKSRFGKVVGVDIIYSKIKNRLYNISAYKWTDGRYYDQNGRSLKGMFLPYPLKFKRISSYFGMRYHPILHKKRMHDGIDLVNKIGTPIHSVAEGKVIYKGWLGGYGKAVKIKHKNGYITLYGHLKGFAHIRKGQWIKQGQVIGYLGNTGLSTGPHLHFGVMKNGKWINPLKIKKSAKITLYGAKRREFKKFVASIQKDIEEKVAIK